MRIYLVSVVTGVAASFPLAEASLLTSYRGGILCSIVLTRYLKFVIYLIFCPVHGKPGLDLHFFRAVQGHTSLHFYFDGIENDLMYNPCT